MLELTDEQQLLVSETRRIAENEFAGNACQWDGKTVAEP